MVSDKVTVISRAYGEDKAHRWESSGADGYTISECEKDAPGTDVIMHMKPDDDNERYSDFLMPWKIMRLVKKYSDYIPLAHSDGRRAPRGQGDGREETRTARPSTRRSPPSSARR